MVCDQLRQVYLVEDTLYMKEDHPGFQLRYTGAANVGIQYCTSITTIKILVLGVI